MMWSSVHCKLVCTIGTELMGRSSPNRLEVLVRLTLIFRELLDYVGPVVHRYFDIITFKHLVYAITAQFNQYLFET